MEEKYIVKLLNIVSGPTMDNLMVAFYLQHESFIDPPFVTLRCKGNGNSQSGTDLAFYPSKVENLDETGQRLSIAGQISCISTDKGYIEPRSSVYTDGYYNAEAGIGLLNIDQNVYEWSEFKKQFETAEKIA